MFVIKQLYIRNYAIIREIDIRFESGFTIITGETGAGKSILIGALSLILGERAEAQVLRDPGEKCIIEAQFDIRSLPAVKEQLREIDPEIGDELIIRREWTAGGRSRVFINDTPATLNALQPLNGILIDLHRQFDTIELQQQDQQLDVLDHMGQHGQLLNEYRNAYRHWKSVNQEYRQVCEHNRKLKEEADYNRFLFEELEQLQLKPHDLEEAEAELSVLSKSEELKGALQRAAFLLTEHEQPATTLLKQAAQSIEPFQSGMEQVRDLFTRIQALHIEAKDVAGELEHLAAHTRHDEERIAYLNDRLQEGNRLLKKHRVQDTAALLHIQQQLDERLQMADQADEQETALAAQLEDARRHLLELSEALRKARLALLEPVTAKLHELLPKVGMPNARMQISHEETEAGPSGSDKITFLLDANKTGRFQPLGKAASGGELSRIMLCIKSLQAKSSGHPTLIFDEIDTGISGETALQVGRLLKELSDSHQLICITHLPQIAGKGDHHLYIFKEEQENEVLHTQVKALDAQERIGILAEMLGGRDRSEEAMQMIKQLMK